MCRVWPRCANALAFLDCVPLQNKIMCSKGKRGSLQIGGYVRICGQSYWDSATLTSPRHTKCMQGELKWNKVPWLLNARQTQQLLQLGSSTLSSGDAVWGLARQLCITRRPGFISRIRGWLPWEKLFTVSVRLQENCEECFEISHLSSRIHL